VIYHGGNVLFRTADRGKTWAPISPDLTRNDKATQGWGGARSRTRVQAAKCTEPSSRSPSHRMMPIPYMWARTTGSCSSRATAARAGQTSPGRRAGGSRERGRGVASRSPAPCTSRSDWIATATTRRTRTSRRTTGKTWTPIVKGLRAGEPVPCR
jgi:hypothetical protein